MLQCFSAEEARTHMGSSHTSPAEAGLLCGTRESHEARRATRRSLIGFGENRQNIISILLVPTLFHHLKKRSF